MTDSALHRIAAFLLRGDMGGAAAEPTPLGIAVRDPRVPLRDDSNYLAVTRRGGSGADVAREVAAGGLSSAFVLGSAEGERLAAELAPLGWTASRGIVMLLAREPDRAARPDAAPPDTLVREVPLAAVEPLRRRMLASHAWATPGAIDDLVAAKSFLAGRVELHAVAAFVDGEAVSAADLYVGDGVAQVEDVATLPEHRNRGLSRAVVLRAIARARERGADDVFLLAAADDWPRLLYARLGFDEIARTVKLSPP